MTCRGAPCRILAQPFISLPLGAAMLLVLCVWTFLRAILGSSAVVTLENVALRHQLAVLHRFLRRPRLRRRDRSSGCGSHGSGRNFKRFMGRGRKRGFGASDATTTRG